MYIAPGNPNRIPIPKAVYKIIQINNTGKIYVFIAVNNPYASFADIENNRNGYKICDDICSRRDIVDLKLITCDRKATVRGNKQKEAVYVNSGYVYMCDIDDFVNGLRTAYGINLHSEFSVKKVSSRGRKPINPVSRSDFTEETEPVAADSLSKILQTFLKGWMSG